MGVIDWIYLVAGIACLVYSIVLLVAVWNIRSYLKDVIKSGGFQGAATMWSRRIIEEVVRKGFVENPKEVEESRRFLDPIEDKRLLWGLDKLTKPTEERLKKEEGRRL